MQSPRPAVITALSVLFLAGGCQTEPPPQAFDSVEYRDGSVFRYRRAMPLKAIPAAAVRTSDAFVQPGGELLFAGREWGAKIDGFRFDKRFGSLHRSVLVDATGKVLERSHEISVGAAPPLGSNAASVFGAILRVEVIQGRRGTPEQFRFTLRDNEAKTRYVFTSDRGSILHHGYAAARQPSS